MGEEFLGERRRCDRLLRLRFGVLPGSNPLYVPEAGKAPDRRLPRRSLQGIPVRPDRIDPHRERPVSPTGRSLFGSTARAEDG